MIINENNQVPYDGATVSARRHSSAFIVIVNHLQTGIQVNCVTEVIRLEVYNNSISGQRQHMPRTPELAGNCYTRLISV